MSLLKKYQSSSKDTAMKVLEDAVGKLEALEASFATAFPYSGVSAASKDFASDSSSLIQSAVNPKVETSLQTALDGVSAISQDVTAISTFIHLHIPKMEDGNNFGVSVQLSLAKLLDDLQDKASAKLEELTGYAAARADALEKLKYSYPSPTSKSVTKSTSTTTTDGKPEEKVSESTEEKSSTTTLESPSVTEQARIAAVVAVDTLYYSKAQRALQSIMVLYMAILDFMDKNKEKLEKPKGSGGSHSGYHSMY